MCCGGRKRHFRMLVCPSYMEWVQPLSFVNGRDSSVTVALPAVLSGRDGRGGPVI